MTSYYHGNVGVVVFDEVQEVVLRGAHWLTVVIWVRFDIWVKLIIQVMLTN